MGAVAHSKWGVQGAETPREGSRYLNSVAPPGVFLFGSDPAPSVAQDSETLTGRRDVTNSPSGSSSKGPDSKQQCK